MELICIGFLFGVVFSLIVFGSGVIFSEILNRLNSREQHNDSGNSSDLPVGGRNRCGNHGIYKHQNGGEE